MIYKTVVLNYNKSAMVNPATNTKKPYLGSIGSNLLTVTNTIQKFALALVYMPLSDDGRGRTAN